MFEYPSQSVVNCLRLMSVIARCVLIRRYNRPGGISIGNIRLAFETWAEMPFVIFAERCGEMMYQLEPSRFICWSASGTEK